MAESPPVRTGAVVRTGVVIVATGVTIALVWFFREILTPLIVATFLLLLIDAMARWVQRLAPAAPAWVRHGLAGVIILAGFVVVGVAMALQAPAFAGRIQALGPRINELIVVYGAQVGLKATSIDQLLKGVNVWNILGAAFATARGVVSYGVLVVIYLGFLIASRATFGKKIESLYESESHRQAAHRVTSSVRTAVQT